MAKKETLKTGKFELDSELDFGDMGFDDIDSQINPEVRKGSKSRKVVSDVFRGTVSGFKDEFKKPRTLAKLTREALPKSYGTLFSAASEVSSSTSKLYDEAVRELKPQLGRISKKIDKLVPDEQKTLKRVTSKISGLFSDGPMVSAMTREQLADQGVANALSQVFGAQQEASVQQEARSNAHARIKEQVEGKRFESNFGILNSINENTARSAAYTERVTQAFQKKSLELQYRSYFVQNELLQLSGKFYEIFKSQNEAIVKNTGLPDYLKITMHERLAQTAKNKFSERTNDFFFGSESAIGRGMKRITDQARDYMKGLQQGVEAALMGVEMTADMSESMKDMGMSTSQLAGMGLGGKGAGIAVKYLGGKANGLLEKTKYASGIRKFGTDSKTAIRNLPGFIESIQKSKGYREKRDGGGFFGALLKAADWIGGNFKDQERDTEIQNPNSLASLSEGGKFDNQTRRSIVEVIPGYLSHILREINMMRTGSETSELLRFDFAKGSFSTKKEIYKSMNKTFSDKIKSSMQGYHLDQFASKITGKGEATEEERQELEKFFKTVNGDKSVEQNKSGVLGSKYFKALSSKKPEIASLVKAHYDGKGASDAKYGTSIKDFLLLLSKKPNFDYTAENILDSGEFKDLRNRSKASAKLVEEFFKKQAKSGEAGSKDRGNNTDAMLDIRGATPDIMYQIQEFVNMGYTDMLIEEGVLTRNNDGKLDVDMKKYHTLVDAGTLDIDLDDKKSLRPSLRPEFRTSDMHAKRNITKFKPKKALAAIRKTPVFNWKYKSGRGNQKQHVGPMAQHVNRNMGEDAAPNGTSIDLINMNGQAMAAIQELAQKQEGVIDSDKGSMSVLGSINENIIKIAEILEKAGGVGSGTGQGDTSYTGILGSMFGNTGRLIGKGLSDVANAGVSAGKAAGKGAMLGAKGLNAVYDKVKDPVAAGAIWALSSAKEMLFKGLEISSDIMFNKIPTASSWLADKMTKTAAWASDKFNELKVVSKDLYLKGRKNPILQSTLLRAGYYRDQATGKAVRTMKDLKNLKGNIVNEAGQLIATIEEVAEGLYDDQGTKIKSLATRLFNKGTNAFTSGIAKGKAFVKGALTGGASLLTKGLDALPAPLKAVLGSFADIGFGSKRIYNVLVDIRDMMRKVTKTAAPKEESASEFIGPMPQSLGNKLKDKISSKLDGWLGSEEESRDPGSRRARNRKAASKRKNKKDNLKNKAGKGKRNNREELIEDGAEPEKKSWKQRAFDSIKSRFSGTAQQSAGQDAQAATGGTTAEPGKRREGSWQDRIAKLSAFSLANRKDQLKADLSARYRSQSNALDGLLGKASDLFDSAKKGMGGIFGDAADAIGDAGDLIEKTGKKAGKTGKRGILGRVAGGMWKATKFVGRGLGGVARFAGRAALTAAMNPAATLNAVRTAATVGSLMTGGVGSAMLGALSVGLSAISGIVLTVPFLGAVVTAGVGFGLYKGYKYLVRDNIGELDEIRMLQYGFNSTLKNYYHLPLQLEDYLCDGRVGYSDGKAFLVDKKIDKKEMLSIFSIDENDAEACAAFGRWFRDRFQSFFLTHMTAMTVVNPKGALTKINDLKVPEKLKYLGMVSFDNGPYREITSPHKEIPSLFDTKDETLALIKKLTQKYSEAMKVKEKKPVTEAEKPKPTAVAAANPATAEAVRRAEALPPALRPGSTKASKYGGDPFTGEDGKEPEFKGGAAKNGYGKPKLVLAGGELLSGDDADQYMRLGKGVSLAGLNPAMLKNLRAMIQEYGQATGKQVTITSGVRSAAQQLALYNKDPSKAAKPGRSLHEFGLALDIAPSDANALEEAGLMRKYGFTRPVGGEPWHVESIGIQNALHIAKNDPTFATQAIAASILQGGGGIGTIRGAALGKRDPVMINAILEGSATTVATSKDDKDKAANDPKVAVGSIAKAQAVNQQFSKRATEDKAANASAIAANGETKPTATTSIGATTAPVNTSSPEDVKAAIMKTANSNGADPNEMALLAAVESTFNPSAKATGTTASGAFQFTEDTWKEQMGKHGRRLGLDPNASPTDLNASTLLATEYAKSNRKSIASVRPNANFTDMYLAHFLGATGARKFLSADPNEIAAKVVPDAALKNKTYFYENGRALTIAEVYSRIDTKLGRVAKEHGISITTGNTFDGTSQTSAASLATKAQTAKSSAPTQAPAVTVSAPVSRPSLVNVPATVMAPVNTTTQQTTKMGNVDFSGLTDTMGKQLSVQMEMRDILKAIADKLDPEVFKDLSKKVDSMNAPQGFVNDAPARGIKSAVDLRRKVA